MILEEIYNDPDLSKSFVETLKITNRLWLKSYIEALIEQNAISLAKRIAKKYNINFDEVLNDVE